MTVAERRQALLEWFYADEERNGWTTSQIHMQATWWRGPIMGAPRWLYPSLGRLDRRKGRDRVYRDLKALERDGQITRGQTSGKATWWYA